MRGAGRRPRYGKLSPSALLRAQVLLGLPHWVRVLMLTSLVAGLVLIQGVVVEVNEGKTLVRVSVAAQHVQGSEGAATFVSGGAHGLVPGRAPNLVKRGEARPELRAAQELRTRTRNSPVDELSRSLNLVQGDSARPVRQEPVLSPARVPAPLSELARGLDDSAINSFTRVRWVDGEGVEHYDVINYRALALGSDISVWMEDGEVVSDPYGRGMTFLMWLTWVLALGLPYRNVGQSLDRRAAGARARLRYHGTALAQERADAQALLLREQRLEALRVLRREHPSMPELGSPERTWVSGELWSLTRPERVRAERQPVVGAGAGARGSELRFEVWERFWDWDGEDDLLLGLTQRWNLSVIPGHMSLEIPGTPSRIQIQGQGPIRRWIERRVERVAIWLLRRTTTHVPDELTHPQRAQRTA